MLEQLTPVQAYELSEYATIEPFGEVRSDLRMANAMLQVYNVNRGKKGRRMKLGEFTLYDDIVESASQEESLQSRLGALVATGRAVMNG